MARTLWGFSVKKATGKDGESIDVVPKSEPGFLMVPAKFPAVLEARSARHAKLMEKSWLDAQKAGLEWTRRKKGIM